jgi:hypothetical protein
MSVTRMGDSLRWALAGAGALGAVVLVGLGFHATVPGPSLPAISRSSKAALFFIQAKGDNSAISEQAMMRDTTPLFLPTERNASGPALAWREPGRAFLDEDTLKLSIGESGLNLAGSLPPVAVFDGRSSALAQPLDALTLDSPGDMLLGFGRVDTSVTPMAARGGFIEVIATATGETVIAQTIPVEAAPPTSKVWQPMEFMAAVDPAGLVGPLVVTDDSRVEEVNAYFRKYLAHSFRLGERLPPGFYRIVVGP